jgi:hypothetical protein
MLRLPAALAAATALATLPAAAQDADLVASGEKIFKRETRSAPNSMT